MKNIMCVLMVFCMGLVVHGATPIPQNSQDQNKAEAYQGAIYLEPSSPDVCNLAYDTGPCLTQDQDRSCSISFTLTRKDLVVADVAVPVTRTSRLHIDPGNYIGTVCDNGTLGNNTSKEVTYRHIDPGRTQNKINGSKVNGSEVNGSSS